MAAIPQRAQPPQRGDGEAGKAQPQTAPAECKDGGKEDGQRGGGGAGTGNAKEEKDAVEAESG